MIGISLFPGRVPANPEVPGLPEPPMMEWHEPAEALLARARALGVPTDGFVAATDEPGVPPGSSLTWLVVQADPESQRQWLVRLVPRALSEAERAQPQPPPLRFFTTAGHDVTFGGERVVIAIQVIGPVEATATSRRRREVKEVWSGATVTGDYLRLGLDRASATMERLVTVARERNFVGGFSWSTEPYPTDVVEGSRAALAQIGLTLDDERALVGTSPALIEFFSIAARTPEVRDILRDLLELNLWSLIRHGGIPRVDLDLLPGAESLDLAGWGMAGFEGRGFPFVLKLAGDPKVVCSLAVIEPRPPYSASAGIVGLAAHRVGDPTRRVVLRLIASRKPPAAAP